MPDQISQNKLSAKEQFNLKEQALIHLILKANMKKTARLRSTNYSTEKEAVLDKSQGSRIHLN